MSHTSRKRTSRLSIALFAALGTAALAVPVVGATVGGIDGAVYTLTNNIGGNEVVVFDRFADGSLGARRSYSTRGTGTGGGLGNQGALALSGSGRWLLAVNPGSNSVSVFLAFGNILYRTDTEASGGSTPVSVTIEDDVVYVLNAGSDNVQGFRLSIYGTLTPIAGSKRALSGAGTGAAQVEFNRDGDLLAVTEKATNRVLTFTVDGDGLLSQARIQDSPAPTPFGFAFGRRDQLLVSEAAGGAAGASTLTSYRLNADASADVISAAVPSGQAAACWVVITRDGRHAYVSNTASGNLSTYRVGSGGVTTLKDAVAATTGDGSGPTDMALDRNSRYLYVLNNTTIGAFRVAADGALTRIEDQSLSGVPAFATGLVAR
jgi:6-phosphogluconolactonase